MKTAAIHSARGGFTLVEVSLAVLVVGLGLLTLFGLFPSGLRSGEDAAADTRAGLFASVVFDEMRAKVSEVDTWTAWDNTATMTSLLCTSLNGVGTLTQGGSVQTLVFPAGGSLSLRYTLQITRVTTVPVRGYSAYLKVWEQTGSLNNYNEFYTEFTYGGR